MSQLNVASSSIVSIIKDIAYVRGSNAMINSIHEFASVKSDCLIKRKYIGVFVKEIIRGGLFGQTKKDFKKFLLDEVKFFQVFF